MLNFTAQHNDHIQILPHTFYPPIQLIFFLPILFLSHSLPKKICKSTRSTKLILSLIYKHKHTTFFLLKRIDIHKNRKEINAKNAIALPITKITSHLLQSYPKSPSTYNFHLIQWHLIF